MFWKTARQQASSFRILTLCLAALLMSGSNVIANSKGNQGNQPSAAVAARFLEQSSWGPTAASIAQVQAAADLPTYIQQQFSAPISTYATPGPTDDLTFVQNQF